MIVYINIELIYAIILFIEHIKKLKI